MSTPLQITFKDMDPSPAIESLIRQKAAQLDRFFERAGHCHVVVFDALEIGREVRLEIAEDESESGWQATTVHPVGKHHPVP